MERRIEVLSARIARWTATEWRQPGRIAARATREEHDRGSAADCARIAQANGAPTLADETLPSASGPFPDQVSTTPWEDGSIVEVWCRSTPIDDGNATTWRVLLPSVAEVYPVVHQHERDR